MFRNNQALAERILFTQDQEYASLAFSQTRKPLHESRGSQTTEFKYLKRINREKV
jgi:hypothetical protein